MNTFQGLKKLKDKGLTLSLRVCKKGRFGVKTRAKNNSKAVILKPSLIKAVQANTAFKVVLKAG
ncbi:hypothetical protein JCM30760_26730 [Thiomicrorhabdus hydrogeniphila]